jgi:hypothetical protein
MRFRDILILCGKVITFRLLYLFLDFVISLSYFASDSSVPNFQMSLNHLFECAHSSPENGASHNTVLLKVETF